MSKEKAIMSLQTPLIRDCVTKNGFVEFHNGTYDKLMYIYYQTMKLLYEGTAYQGIYDFYLNRDKMIAQNIIDIINNNKGHRIILVMGADHRHYSMYTIHEYFKAEFENGQMKWLTVE